VRRNKLEDVPLLGRVAGWRKQAVSVRPSEIRLDADVLDSRLRTLGRDRIAAVRVVTAVDEELPAIAGLSSLTSALALDYLDRLSRPIPNLSPQSGVSVVTSGYVAHLAVERDPAAFGVTDVPVLGTLPPLKKRIPPNDLLTRIVKATRRDFALIRALPQPVWDGFVCVLTHRAHNRTPNDDDLVSSDVVDALARFGWVLRQVDIHYGLEPERLGADPTT
jgi:hypothetical protein